MTTYDGKKDEETYENKDSKKSKDDNLWGTHADILDEKTDRAKKVLNCDLHGATDKAPENPESRIVSLVGRLNIPRQTLEEKASRKKPQVTYEMRVHDTCGQPHLVDTPYFVTKLVEQKPVSLKEYGVDIVE